MYTSDLTEAQKAFIKETIPMDNWTSKYDILSRVALKRQIDTAKECGRPVQSVVRIWKRGSKTDFFRAFV